MSGLVLVDGAFPIATLTDAGKANARRTFKRLAPLMRTMSLFGRSTRRSPEQAADLNIELSEISPSLASDYEQITCPVDFIIGSKPHIGTSEERARRMRHSLTPLLEHRHNISIFATLPATHTQILSRQADAIVDAIDDAANRSAG